MGRIKYKCHNPISLLNGALTITCGSSFNGIFQRLSAELISKLMGKKCTASVLLGDGTTVYKGTTVFATPCTFLNYATGDECLLDMDGGNNFRFAIDDVIASISVVAIKLEVGEASTILLDAPRPYAEELARCQTSSAQSSDTYANKGNLVTSNSIAPTEDGATASKAYVVGETFFRGGDYCVCISPISANGSFTLNTNYKVTSLANTSDFKPYSAGTIDDTNCHFDYFCFASEKQAYVTIKAFTAKTSGTFSYNLFPKPLMGVHFELFGVIVGADSHIASCWQDNNATNIHFRIHNATGVGYISYSYLIE